MYDETHRKRKSDLPKSFSLWMADLSNCGSLALEHMLLITMSCCFHWLSQVWGVPISSILSHCLHEPIKCLKNPRSYLKFIFYMPVVGNLHLDFSHLSIILAPDFIVTIYFTCEVKALLGLPASIFQDCVGQQICEKCVEWGWIEGFRNTFFTSIKAKYWFGCQVFFPAPLMPHTAAGRVFLLLPSS